MNSSGKKQDSKQALFNISKDENFPDWYGEICRVAELA